MNPRSRYPPPGMGNGRGGGASTNPNFYARSAHQHQQYAQQSPAHGQPRQQFQQQQQWSRRNQLGGDFGAGQIVKSVQSEATNTRYTGRKGPWLKLLVMFVNSLVGFHFLNTWKLPQRIELCGPPLIVLTSGCHLLETLQLGPVMIRWFPA